MKHLLYMLLSIVFYTKGIAQAQNIGLQYINHSTGITNNYTTGDINSDFGPREVNPPDSKWHKGIDLNRGASDSDKGDRIITPVSGTIAQIYKNGSYIVLVVDGPDNQDYGYGHIFTNGPFPISLSGFVLKSIKYNNNYINVIIDVSNNRAFSTFPGINIVHNSIPYITTNTVQAGWPVAPVGYSASVDYKTHLHLYLYKDPSLNAQGLNNCKNPLQLITHQNTDLDISIRSISNLTEYGNTTFYSGNQPASIQVVDTMQTSSDPPLNNLTYSNAIMDIDSVIVQIKKYGEPDTKYQNIKGSHYQSKIVLGGRLDHKRYPDNIDETKGDITHVGVEPHAYNDNDDAKDFYYFSDFFTRIKNTDQYGGTLNLANSNSEARYPDGVYLIKPRAFRINNTEATNPANPNNNALKQIIIDNFRPYISRVKIYEGSTSNGVLKYNRGWQWANNSLQLEPQPNTAYFSQTQNIKVIITTSEPMLDVTLQVGNLTPQLLQCGTELNKTTWEFIVPIANSSSGEKQFTISGHDLANNPIQSNPRVIPIRQSNTVWQPIRSRANPFA